MDIFRSLAEEWEDFFYISQKGPVDSESAWKLQNEQMQANVVYKMVNFSQAGSLIDAYDKGGDSPELRAKSLEKYFLSEIEPEFVHDSMEAVTFERYQQWHNYNAHTAIRFVESGKLHDEPGIKHFEDDTLSNVSLDSVIHPFTQHSIKWRLDKRGAVGETPLHLLLLLNTEKSIKIAQCLLKLCPELAADVYEGAEYYGESGLHLAITQRNFNACAMLLETKMVDVHARARGNFFIPTNVKRGDFRMKKSKYQGYAYYGEFPLSFAVCTGQMDCYNLLVSHGADPRRQDSRGNNVLHMAVIFEQFAMYQHILSHPDTCPDPNTKNLAGHTPLSLAAFLGRKDMFSRIMDLSRKEFWSYNKVSCFSYPLQHFDSIDENGLTDWDSSLLKIVQGNKEDHYDMLEDNIVNRLLHEKWDRYSRRTFIKQTLFYLMHMIFFSVAIWLRPSQDMNLLYGTNVKSIFRYIFECLTILFFSNYIGSDGKRHLSYWFSQLSTI